MSLFQKRQVYIIPNFHSIIKVLTLGGKVMDVLHDKIVNGMYFKEPE